MRAVFFDLDNTLYDVSQYYLGAFRRISSYLSAKCSIPEEDIYERSAEIWKEKTSMYPRLFDDLLSSLGATEELQQVIDSFNAYDGALNPYDDTLPILNHLRTNHFALGIITDGSVSRQRRKIRLLGLDGFFDVIIFTKDTGLSKSSGIPFREAANRVGAVPSSSFYVGDNPILDFAGAKEAELKTVRLLRGEFSTLPSSTLVDFEASSLEELRGIIQ